MGQMPIGRKMPCYTWRV